MNKRSIALAYSKNVKEKLKKNIKLITEKFYLQDKTKPYN